MPNLLLTGATGFIGSALLKEILCNHKNYKPLAAVRSPSKKIPADLQTVVGEISESTDWSAALKSVDVIIHLAARVHVMNDTAENPLAEFRKINTAGTLHLAKQTAAAGVKRFIFISSIKVNGESTKIGKPFTIEDKPAPEDAYGISKYEAEVGLQKIAEETGLKVVIIRLPLIYGPGVKANFLALLKTVKKGIPLPLKCVKQNKRSLLSLDNLIDLIIRCIDHPKAANQVFLTSDDEDVSTAVLLEKMAKVLDKPSRLLPVPISVLKLAGKLTGKSDIINRLCGSLQVDISKTKQLLDWKPPVSLEEGLRKVVISL